MTQLEQMKDGFALSVGKTSLLDATTTMGNGNVTNATNGPTPFSMDLKMDVSNAAPKMWLIPNAMT